MSKWLLTKSHCYFVIMAVEQVEQMCHKRIMYQQKIVFE